MKKEILTLKKLKKMKPHTIFEFRLGHSGIRTFKWVAKRGYIHDWAIYTSLNAVPFKDLWAGDKERISEWGEKVTDEIMIKELVPCDDEAFKMYRY